MVTTGENSVPRDVHSPAGGRDEGRKIGAQYRVDRDAVPSLTADSDVAVASGLSRATAGPLTSVIDDHADVPSGGVTQTSTALQIGEPVSIVTSAESPASGVGTRRPRLRDRDGWVVLVDGNGTVVDHPEQPTRDTSQLLPKGRERTMEVSRVSFEVREEAKRRMTGADSLRDFVLWHRAAYLDGQSDRVGWKWNSRRPTAEDLLADNETAENSAEIAEKVATIESLKEKIDGLSPRDDMVRVAMKRIDNDFGPLSIPSYQVLATFPPGIFVEDALERFFHKTETEKAQREAKEKGEMATVFVEPQSPCVITACGDLEAEFGEEAFYIPFRELVREWEKVDGAINGIKPGADGKYYYVTERAPDGTAIATEDKSNYLLSALQGGFRDSDYFRVRISDYPHWETDYASAQNDNSAGEPAQPEGQAVAHELTPGKPAQLADSGRGDGSDKGGRPTLDGEAGDENDDRKATNPDEDGATPRRRPRPMFTLVAEPIAAPPIVDSEIPHQVTNAIIQEEFPTPPRLESAVLEEFLTEQMQRGVVAPDAVADAFVQEGYSAKMEEYLQRLKDKSATLDWDNIFSEEDYEDVKSKLSAEMEAMGMNAEQIAAVNQMGVKFTEGGGISSLDSENIYVSKLQILRRALNYQEVFGTDIPLEEIVKIMMKATAGHELGHTIDHVTPGYAVNHIAPDSEWMKDGQSIENKGERFAEYWGRVVVAGDETQARIIQRDWAILTTKNNQVWDVVRAHNGANEPKAELYKILRAIMDKLAAQGSPLLPLVESKMLGYGSNAVENYAAFYPRDVVAGAVAAEGRVQARTEIPQIAEQSASEKGQ